MVSGKLESRRKPDSRRPPDTHKQLVVPEPPARKFLLVGQAHRCYTPGIMGEEPQIPRPLDEKTKVEHLKIVIGALVGLVRTLLTLSSGAVILVATFLRDVFPEPVAGPLLIAALVFLAVTIIAAPASLAAVITSEGLVHETSGMATLADVKRIEGVGSRLFLLALSTFILGIGCLAAFVIWNLSVR